MGIDQQINPPAEAILVSLVNVVALPYIRAQIRSATTSNWDNLSASAWIIVNGIFDSKPRKIGTLCRVLSKPSSDTVAIEGIARVSLDDPSLSGKLVKVNLISDNPFPLPSSGVEEVKNLVVEITGKLNELMKIMSMSATTNSSVKVPPSGSPQMLISLVAAALMSSRSLSPEEVQVHILESSDTVEKLKYVSHSLSTAIESFRIRVEVNETIVKKHNAEMRNMLIRKQIAELQSQLSADKSSYSKDGEDDLLILKKKLIDFTPLFPNEVQKIVTKELKRIESIHAAAMNHPEYPGIVSYLETIASLPWSREQKENNDLIDLNLARKELDKNHFGLNKVKQRIIEFLAVSQLVSPVKGEILCLLGPPGVGKTSIAESIAKVMNRKFVRISLSGVRDESELRGHRKTYIGAMPGLIIQSLIRAGVSNPVILLDEIDKISNAGNSSMRPSSGSIGGVLLELLDPEQNKFFRDAYLNFGFDLSRCVFVCTCNSSSGLSRPLFDRLQILTVDSYTEAEKLAIAKNHLIKRAFRSTGLEGRIDIQIPDPVLRHVISKYTMEAGVRELGRKLVEIFRPYSLEVCLKTKEDSKQETTVKVLSVQDIENILGPGLVDGPRIPSQLPVGVSLGLAVSPLTGGDVLFVESVFTSAAGSPKPTTVTVTGLLGEVMKESVRTALSLLMSRLSLAQKSADIHVHFPNGSVQKDGPSAGVATFLALASLFSGTPVCSDIASTGEITLRGDVLPIGGVKEKILAAHRAGLKKVLLPLGNKNSIKEDDIPHPILTEISLVYVQTVEEALEAAFPQPLNSTTKPLYKKSYL